ncbi:MAG TPA: AzlC family ABC transporter permease [Syntrophomonadaceae bacterium]|nr:AzlC family ABC transporter permease [Syntrophomonadaceae bacterium]
MKNQETIDGITDALPIVLGYLPLGFAFGVLAVEAGMTVTQATVMSILCFTGAGQYVGIGVMQAGGAVLTAIIANLLINLRYFLFSTSLVPHLKVIPTKIAAFLSYGLTDETYAVAINRYQSKSASAYYMAGLNLTSHMGWIGSTLLGAVLGNLITNTDKFGLGFALPAMYICLLVLLVSKRNEAVVAAIAAVLCLVIGHLYPPSMANLSNIIIATLIAATIGVMLRD